MKKIILLLILSTILALGFGDVFLLDNKVSNDRFRVMGDALFVHAVSFLEMINAEYYWDNSEKKLEVNFGRNNIVFFSSSEKVVKNGKYFYISTAPRIIDDRFFLPLLEACKIFGLRMVSDGGDYRVFSEQSTFEKYFFIPDGLVLCFDFPVSYMIREKDNQKYVLDIIGAVTKRIITIENSNCGINRISLENKNSESVAEFLQVSLEVEEKNNLTVSSLGNYLIVKASFDEKIEKDSRKLIVIDPGHGGIDPGAPGLNNLQEKDINLDISIKLKEVLENNGFRVKLTRNTDAYVDLKERAIIANEVEADLFLSIHMNSFENKSVDGMEFFFYKWDAESYKIRLQRLYSADFLTEKKVNELISAKIGVVMKSETLTDELSAEFEKEKYNVRKKTKEDFAVLAYSSVPAVLIECGFITNPEFASSVLKETWKDKFAKTLAQGIKNYFQKVPK